MHYVDVVKSKEDSHPSLEALERDAADTLVWLAAATSRSKTMKLLEIE
jgi:hypothetical protein